MVSPRGASINGVKNLGRFFDVYNFYKKSLASVAIVAMVALLKNIKPTEGLKHEPDTTKQEEDSHESSNHSDPGK